MVHPEIEQFLQGLRDYVAGPATNGGDLDEIRVKKTQLREIQNTIRHLEKKNIPVPAGLNTEKLALITALEKLDGASGGAAHVYEQLAHILADLGRVCNRLPHKDLYRWSREWRKKVTPPADLRKLILTVLGDMGGGGKQRDILARIKEKMAGRFTDADQERALGRSFRWETNVKRERNRMIAEGLLTPDSKRSTWKLAK